MSQTRYGRKKRLMSEINVVPYIDVMLVLLIIFMVTAPLLSTGVKIELPKAAAQQMNDDDQEPFVVTVDADGNYYLNDDETKLISAEEIELKAKAVLQANSTLSFLVARRWCGEIRACGTGYGVVAKRRGGVGWIDYGSARNPVVGLCASDERTNTVYWAICKIGIIYHYHPQHIAGGTVFLAVAVF